MADMTAGTLLSYARERESLSKGLREMAALNGLGSISTSDARSMAEIMQEGAYSFQNRALGKDLDVIQENVLGFDAAGGFSNVTSSEEMGKVLEGVVENTRQFANTFKMKQEEAVQIMAELQNSMVVSMDSLGEFTSRMGYVGDVTGMGAAGASQFGMQGVQMLRGTGMSSAQRFDMAIESRMQAEQLRYADPVTRQLLYDAGGPEGFATRQLETTNRWAMSGQGMLNMAALLGGTSLGGDLSSIIGGAANYLQGDPSNILALQANMGAMTGAAGFNNLNAMSVSQAYNMANTIGLTGPGGQISEDILASLYANMTGVGQDTALGAVKNFRNYAQSDPQAQEVNQLIRQISDVAEANRTTGPGRFFAGIMEGGENFIRGSADAIGLNDFFVNTLVDGGRELTTDIKDWFSGTQTYDSITLSERGREAFNRLRGEGAFTLTDPSNESLDRARARIMFGEDRARANPNLRADRPLDYIYAGVSDTDAINKVLNNHIQDTEFLELREKYDGGAADIDLFRGAGDDRLVSSDLMQSVKNVLAFQDINYADATPAELSGAIQRVDALRGGSTLQDALSASQSGQRIVVSEARANELENRISNLDSERESYVNQMIQRVDKQNIENGSFEELFKGSAQIRVFNALKSNDLTLLPDGLTGEQLNYIEQAQKTEFVPKINKLSGEIESFEAWGGVLEDSASIFNNLELGSYSSYGRMLEKRVNAQVGALANSNINSFSIVDLSKQGGGREAIQKALNAADLDKSDITTFMTRLEGGDFASQMEAFQGIEAKIGDNSVFRAAVDNIEDVNIRGRVLDMMGTDDSVESMLNRTISDDAIRVKAVNEDGVPISPKEDFSSWF